MKPTRLLPLLASLQMLPRTVSPADPLPASQLTVSPPQPVYISGEAVTLTCWAAGASAMAGIQFFRNGQGILSKELPSPQYHYTHSMELPRVTGQQHGAYSCAYWSTESGQKIQSMRSQPISIKVTAKLSAPKLTVSPQHRIFLRGESVTLTCSAPSTATVSGIQFFRDGKSIDYGELQWSQQNARSLKLSSVSESHAGAYSCDYWKTKSGREIPSERSQNIPIAVTDWSSVPKLTLSSPYPVLLRGESVILTCSVPNTDKVSEIRFFRDERRIRSSELQWSQYRVTASLLLLSVSESRAGKYSCDYCEKGSWREIPSERSHNVVITVTAWLSAPELTVSPQHRVFLHGEYVNLTCLAPSTATVSGIQFFRDGQRIDSRELQWSGRSVNSSLLLSSGSESQAIVYSCGYWETMSGREIPSERSRPVPIFVTARPPPPSLSLHPPEPIYIRGELVTLTCLDQLNEEAAGYRFFNQSGEQISSQVTWQVSTRDAAASQAYTCLYWREERGREIPSEKSPPVPVSVTDLPPQPELSVDPLSGAVSEGFPLNIICTAPGDARERKFHFYKDGDELLPGDLGSEISTMEPGNSSVKGSVLSIPWAGSNITGEFACGYEENVSGRWILSHRSSAWNVTGNVTTSVHGFRWVRELAVGGSFFLINGIIFYVSYRCF